MIQTIYQYDPFYLEMMARVLVLSIVCLIFIIFNPPQD